MLLLATNNFHHDRPPICHRFSTTPFFSIGAFGQVTAVITQFTSPVAAGGEVTLTGTFPTGSVPVITLDNGGTTPVATLTAGSNSTSQIQATVPAGTASGTYGPKVKFRNRGFVRLRGADGAELCGGHGRRHDAATTFNLAAHHLLTFPG